MDNKQGARVTLKTVATHLGLTPGTISAVLNNTLACKRIPQPTKDRIFAAARQLHYQPNLLARALRTGKALPVPVECYDYGLTRGALVISDADCFVLACYSHRQERLRIA